MLMCRSQPRKKPFKPAVVNYEEDIIDIEVVDVVKKTGETDRDFIIAQEVVETSRVNRTEFLNSQAKDHSIYAIIDKVCQTGDITLLKRETNHVYGDGTLIMADRGEIINEGNKVKEQALKNIPSELIGDQTLEEFLKNVTEEAISNYYASKQQGKKEEESNG